MTTSSEERLSSLEGAYEHLAAKADIARLEGRVDVLTVQMNSMETRLVNKLYVVGMAVAGVILTGMALMLRFWS